MTPCLTDPDCRVAMILLMYRSKISRADCLDSGLRVKSVRGKTDLSQLMQLSGSLTDYH